MVTENQVQQTMATHQQQQTTSDHHSHHHHQTDGVASFLRAARAGNLDKVLEYLKGSFDINTCNANGLNALHLASKEGHVNVVTELLRRGANVNTATKKGNTALHIASLAGQDEVVKVLIMNGANVNVQSVNGFTPLYMAAQENHDCVVRYLLANGANQSLATEDGFTPLAVALQQGHDRVVAVLLENDTKGKVRLPALHVAAKKDDCKAATLLLQNDHNPDVTSKSGFTPLHIAAHYGNENIGALLLEKNADVNFAAKHQVTPLHVAAKWGKVNIVSLLLDYKAKIDAATQDGLTPLHCAARSGHKFVIELLMERGAPISPKTKNGLAPLHMAAQGDHVECAKVLLDHKAPVDDVTVDYLTPLHVASHCGHVRVAKLLLDRKADPNARALNGFTPLHIACKKNRIKIVELLLKHGASIEATTESGLTPLHVASFMGCMNIVIYLIQHMANPDVQTIRGETPLHLAARANQTDIIRVLLRNGAQVDAKARENQTPLHISARLGNADIVSLLLQHGASVDAVTKDQYTALHIATKDGQEETAAILLDNGASLTAQTKKGFTPLHLAAKYGNIKVARLLISRKAPVDAQGKNNVTPLHCAAHYDHVNIALLLLEEKASPHATAKNGYTPLHIAARKNQIDIATTLLEYTANPNAESKAGFTPLHLAAQEGHTDMVALLIQHHANVNAKSKNGLTPMHLCAQNDRVNVASILAKNNASVSLQTKEGYTPLHAAAHFGQINMVRYLLKNGAKVNTVNCHGYTPLHQAAQQGHVQIVNLLLEHKASPNVMTNQGQTALSIAQKLGYISVVETLKVVTETIVTTTTTTITEEKYKVVAPEVMHESFMSDSEDEGGEEYMVEVKNTSDKLSHPQTKVFTKSTEELLGDHSYRYLTGDEMKFLGDDSLPIDVTKDERMNETFGKDSLAPITIDEELLSPQYFAMTESYVNALTPDNIDISKAPVNTGDNQSDGGDHQQQQHHITKTLLPYKRMARSRPLKWRNFLVSFMVDARGGAMRGCRHSGVRVIIPPRKAPMPMRITCRYVKREKLVHPPLLMDGEACASRILEMGPAGAKFLGPVIIEVPHFASLRGKERDIIIFRSDNGETWREHTLEATEEAVLEVLNASFEGENDVNGLDDFNNNRITRILTTDFPQYFAIITRIRHEVHAIGPEGGILSSTVVPQVQAIFPEGALTKKIKVGLQAQPIPNELVTKLLGNRVAVSPICTIEPRRRKFHKPITLTIPLPQAANRGMINQYSVDTPTLRLLCSITGGSAKAQWEDVTGSTPLTFVNSCVSFTTTVSARFWLIDCREINNATKYAIELYQESIHVPFMAKFVVFAKRVEPNEAQIRVFCMTDDKEEKTLEHQENFTEIAKSRDVEVLEGKAQFLEFASNLTPVTKSGEQLYLIFNAFRENRLPFVARVKDPNQGPSGRIAFMRDSRKIKSDHPQQPICTLNLKLPEIMPESNKMSTYDKVDIDQEIIISMEKPLESIEKKQMNIVNKAPPITNGYVNNEMCVSQLQKEPEIKESVQKKFVSKMNAPSGQKKRSSSTASSSSISSQSSKSSSDSNNQKKNSKSQQEFNNISQKNKNDLIRQPIQQNIVKEEITISTEYPKEGGFEQAKQEMETWQSVEQDTSQVSFSSLPEDEKSEPSITISSTTNINDHVLSSSDDPKMDTIVQQKEWIEEGEDGVVKKHVQQTTVKSSAQQLEQGIVLTKKIESVSHKQTNKNDLEKGPHSSLDKVENRIQSKEKSDFTRSFDLIQSEKIIPSVEPKISESKIDKISQQKQFGKDESTDKIDMRDIKREAISITSNIVQCAKNELTKKSFASKLSVEISDEDMVEKDDNELEAIKEKLRSDEKVVEIEEISTPIVIKEFELTDSKELIRKNNLKISPNKEEMKEMVSSSESSQPLSEQFKTPTSSRPQSSEYDMTIIQEVTSGSHISSEYLTCPMTRDSSFSTVPTSSQEASQYFTPQSNFSGKISSPSIQTTGSSSNLGEISEASETIVHSDDNATSKSDDETNYFDEQYMKINKIDTTDIEPFNYEIPSSMLKDDWQIFNNKQTSSAQDDKIRTKSYYVDPFEEEENINQVLSSYKASSPLESLDKNLYTHVEVEEESDDILDAKKFMHQVSPKNISIKMESETTSSTSSLKEFERLECEVVKEKDDFSVDSKYSLESNKLEKIGSDNLSLYDQEDFNESLNSELSQDVITCIKISQTQTKTSLDDDNNRPSKEKLKSLAKNEISEMFDTHIIEESGPQLLSDDHDNQSCQFKLKDSSELLLSSQEECFFAPEPDSNQTIFRSMDSNLNPVLDCDFSSLSSTASMSASNDNGLNLHCDEQIHPVLTASLTQFDNGDFENAEPGKESRIIMMETETITDDGASHKIETQIEHKQRKSSTSSSSSSSSSTSSDSVKKQQQKK